MSPGRLIGGYEIQEEIGRGAMGIVFKARQLSMDRIVAIKFLPKRLAQDERTVARFLREARAAGQLSHPNIVSVHELGLAEGMHFIAMEFVDGNSIQRKIKEKGPFNEKDTLEIGLQIAEALKMAHSRGVLHRDIKPDNFLIDSAGRVRLADLGLAQVESAKDGSLTQDGTTLGTPHFMSPEQCSGSGTDARSDLYSLGASMFVMCCGRTPYEGNTAAGVMVKVLTEQPASLKKLRPELSPGFVALVEKLMHKDPAKRFQNAGAAAEAIALCRAGQYKAPAAPVTQAKPPALKPSAKAPGGTKGGEPAPLPKDAPSKLIPLALGAGAALMLIVVLAMYKSRGNPQAAAVAPQQPAVIGKVEEPPVRGTKIELSGPGVTQPAQPAPQPIKQPEPLRPSPQNPKRPGPRPNSPMEQFTEIDNAYMRKEVKLAETAKRIAEFRAQHAKIFENNLKGGLPHRVMMFEAELGRRQQEIMLEWKKLEATVNLELKTAPLKDVLTKLSKFAADNEGLPEAKSASEKIDALLNERIEAARKLAEGNNPREAAAQLAELAEISTLPQSSAEAVKNAFNAYTEQIKSGGELAALYNDATSLLLKADRLEKKYLRFDDAAKLCRDSAPKAKFETNKQDFLELAKIFEAAKNVFTGMRDQIISGKRVELPSLMNFSKTRVVVEQWVEPEILFTTAEIKQQQPINFYSPSAPEAILTIAQEMKRPAFKTAGALWEVGVLALAFNNQAVASKFIRDALAKDETVVPKPMASVALKLLKPLDIPSAKPPEKSPEAAPPVATNREKDAEQLLKDMQDASKAGDKAKLTALGADAATKFADTEFFKAHKKEFDDLAAATPPAPQPPPPAPTVKVDNKSPQQKEAEEALVKLGWPAENIAGNWSIDKKTGIFTVDGLGELLVPALECEMVVKYQMLADNSKMRVLTRVDKASPPDRFAGFGTDKGLGFGADVSATHVYVYVDNKTPAPQLFGSAIKLPSGRQPGEVRVRHRNGVISVTVNNGEPKTSGRDVARYTGDARIIVSGPIQLIPQLTVFPSKPQPQQP